MTEEKKDKTKTTACTNPIPTIIHTIYLKSSPFQCAGSNMQKKKKYNSVINKMHTYFYIELIYKYIYIYIYMYIYIIES